MDKAVLFGKDAIEKSRELTADWEESVYKVLAETPDRREHCSTVSDLDIKRLYTPEDIKRTDFAEDIGVPGTYPITISTIFKK